LYAASYPKPVLTYEISRIVVGAPVLPSQLSDLVICFGRVEV